MFTGRGKLLELLEGESVRYDIEVRKTYKNYFDSTSIILGIWIA